MDQYPTLGFKTSDYRSNEKRDKEDTGHQECKNAIAHDAMGQTDVRNSPITTLIDHINIGQGDYSGSKTLISTKHKGTNPDKRSNHNLTDKGREERR